MVKIILFILNHNKYQVNNKKGNNNESWSIRSKAWHDSRFC